MQIQRSLMTFFLQKNITYKNKVYVRDVHYYTDDLLVPYKECLDYKVQCII